MIKLLQIIIISIVVIPSFCLADEGGELFFDSVKVAIHLIDPDSIRVEVNAGTEDLFNTVGVFPHPNSDKAVFLLFERQVEGYLQTRIPIQIDGKSLHLKVVQWKPDGRGRGDGFDSSLATTLENSITLGGTLPKNRKYLSTHVDMWTERDDAADTKVAFFLFHNNILLKQEISKREKIWKVPLSLDSLVVMEKRIKSR